jgi:hypothetical protein
VCYCRMRTYLLSHESQCAHGTGWESAPETVRELVREYVVQRLQCHARRSQGYEVIGRERGEFE